MTAPPTRDQQRAGSEEAIIEAAWHRIATSGPDGASLRQIARRAGCTHGLVANHFGSKDRLVDAVGDRLTARIDDAVRHAWPERPDPSTDPLGALLATARSAPSCTRLLVRCGLGDLRPGGFPTVLPIERILDIARTEPADPPDDQARLGAYAAASLLLGWLTFEGFLVAGTGLGPLEPHRRDLAIAAATHAILNAARTRPAAPRRADRTGITLDHPDPTRSARRDVSPADPRVTDAGTRSARDALLVSAVELFAARGPASVSVREVAYHAGVNHGLVHRHFGSKDALITDAIELGSSPVFPAALSEDGFDLHAVVRILHAQPNTARLIARTLVDGIDIDLVRRQFPVLHRLLDRYGDIPTGTGSGSLTDPRIAVAGAAAVVLGSVTWGTHLRPSLGLDDNGQVEVAVTEYAQDLLDLSPASRG